MRFLAFHVLVAVSLAAAEPAPALSARDGEEAAAVAAWNHDLSVLARRTGPPGKRLQVVIESNGGRLRVRSAKVVDRPRKVEYRQRLATGRYYLEFLDASGAVRHVQSVADPAVAYVDVPAGTPDGRLRESRRVRRSKAALTASVPFDPEVAKVRVSVQRVERRATGPGFPLGGPFLLGDAPAALPDGVELEPQVLLDLPPGWERGR